uniref:F-box domain-containing protein n=1 Tax=Mycena chlorophos TaxID=658473 RepID=A0ABQ0M3H9_MYCCL|nr:predicted protein [Mycena chlorophos]
MLSPNEGTIFPWQLPTESSRYLTNNCSPTDDERAVYERLLVSTRLEFKRMTPWTASFDYTASLHDNIIAYEKLLSPARRLPTELWLEIFHCFVTRRVDNELVPTAPWRLTHVCRNWRYIAHAEASLWTHFPIEAEGPGGCFIHLPLLYDPLAAITMQLRLSGSAPLTVELTGPQPISESGIILRAEQLHYQRHLSAVAAESHRWEKLTVHRCDGLPSAFAPDLAALKIAHVDGGNGFPSVLLSRAPLLEELEFLHTFPGQIPPFPHFGNFEASWSTLKRLDICLPIADLLLVLRNTPCLEWGCLQVVWEDTESTEPLRPLISLPALRTLRVDCDGGDSVAALLTSLVAPALSKLTVDGNVEGVVELILQSDKPPITHLCMTDEDFDFAGLVLPRVPELRVLDLAQPDFCVPVIDACEFFSTMRYQDEDEDETSGRVCERLEMFCCVFHGSARDQRYFVKMVHSWWNIPGVRRTLRKVVVPSRKSLSEYALKQLDRLASWPGTQDAENEISKQSSARCRFVFAFLARIRGVDAGTVGGIIGWPALTTEGRRRSFMGIAGQTAEMGVGSLDARRFHRASMPSVAWRSGDRDSNSRARPDPLPSTHGRRQPPQPSKSPRRTGPAHGTQHRSTAKTWLPDALVAVHHALHLLPSTDSVDPHPSLPASGARLPTLTLGVDEFGLAASEQTSATYGAVGFLPTGIPRDLANPFSAPTPPGQPPQPPARTQYGLLSAARDTVLGLPEAARLTTTVCAALERTGVATPFVFSSLALDARKAGVVRLAHAFLTMHPDQFEEEARFSGAHELALCLRWGLSRVVRVEGGRELRGLLSWAWYERWKAEEAANSYPPTAYSTFIDSLPAQLAPILRPLFALCTKLVAHSAASGHTPPSLAAILSPLLFGLSPPPVSTGPAPASYPTPTSPTGKSSKKDKGDKDKDKDDPEALLFPTVEDFSTFNGVYEEYLRGARAAEHLLLACIREDVSAAGGALGGPTRLREWVGMYPASIDTGSGTGNHTNGQGRIGARRGAKTVRVVHVRRNVRSYSGDLVKSGSSWAESGGSGTTNDWSASRAWRTILAGGAGAPRYTDAYRKRMDMPVGVHPSTTSLSSSTSSASSTPFSSLSASTNTNSGSLTSPSSVSLVSTTESTAPGAFRSLTDLQWGAFESLGFEHGSGFEVGVAGPGDKKSGGIEGRLRFDLTENARAERAAKRETLSWADFSAAGFSRSDAPLSATLQFSAPLSLTLSSPGASSPGAGLNAEMTRKLRKAHKALPAFGWDTNPVMGAEDVVEEAFVDVFCDLLYGGGWMERAAGVGGVSAELARECSWALVEYKSRSGGQQDSGATLVLYEEFVPREYRLALAGVAPPGTRRRLPSFFTPSTVPGGGKAWKQAPTLNGRPYVLGATPMATASSRDLDFDSMLRAQGQSTKMISLSATPKAPPPQTPGQTRLPDPPPGAAAALHPGMSRTQSGDSAESDPTHGTSKNGKRASARFRLPGGMIPNPSPGFSHGGGGGGGVPKTVVRPGMTPAESAPVEFRTRMAVAGGENGSDSEEGEDESARDARQRRRESASDAWVDILVGSMAGRRMDGQSAVMRTTGTGRRVRARHDSDGGIKGLEAARALAAETMMSRASIDVDEPVPLRDSDVVEVERVPRKQLYEEEAASEDGGQEAYGQHTDDEEDSLTPGAEVHPVLAQARAARRAGYFDLHPDRRPVSISSVSAASDADTDEDPRKALSAADSDEEPEPLIPTPRNLDMITAIRPLPTPTKSPISPNPIDVVPQQFRNANLEEEDRRRAEREHARTKADSVILKPAPAGNGTAAANGAIAAPKPSQPSKTSALIDMFREKEQGGRASPAGKPAGPSPLPASRLPVRTSSAGGGGGGTTPQSPQGPRPTPTKERQPVPPAPAPAPAAALPPAPAPEAIPAKSSPPLLDPPEIPDDNQGRASPARYVHGAPLHNVLEEEEEED